MITVGRYTWIPRRLRRTTLEMTLTKLLLAPIAAAGVTVALIGWGQPYVLHQDFSQGEVPTVEVRSR